MQKEKAKKPKVTLTSQKVLISVLTQNVKNLVLANVEFKYNQKALEAAYEQLTVNRRLLKIQQELTDDYKKASQIARKNSESYVSIRNTIKVLVSFAAHKPLNIEPEYLGLLCFLSDICDGEIQL